MWRGWRDVLSRLGFTTAALDAKLLAQHGLGLNALELATRENDLADEASAAQLATLMQRRMTGESVARIIGEREFYGLAFGLNAGTLEPRPDTELLVDLALGAMPAEGRVLDLGTGTGCIPIAMLANMAGISGVAVDLSALALQAAQANAARHDVAGRLSLHAGSWFEPVPAQRFDLIVSNPPYIATDVVETLAGEVRDFDPRLALDGGPDGLAPYRIIARLADGWLVENGHVLVEIGHDQGASVSALFLEAGFENVSVHKDLAGLDRVVRAHHL
ncbi:peptide chain release factor N(5)-glutamine methyltransferase [Devosia neptuniae]|uniref:peptide chain release factor N(5)-glutamine methyltransferase n=1 Tax=uncultured Devosia sp. TaxID=211434 RepID=UPI0022AFA11E|nr:peptide chain release factor N(5)-glutamine methyltransferase [Devosia neptuniae]MCZ4347509.1 peptide chain release factor N(5)-glutamine methyltransferase [Devosia neptuniae]